MAPALDETVCDRLDKHRGCTRYNFFPGINTGSIDCVVHGHVSEPYKEESNQKLHPLLTEGEHKVQQLHKLVLQSGMMKKKLTATILESASR